MIRLESTSDQCYHFGFVEPGKQFAARERVAAVLIALKRAKPVSEAPAAAIHTNSMTAEGAAKPARKPRQARDPDRPKRAYRRRDMRAEG